MQVEIVEAELSDPAHSTGLLAVLDSYASDPMGGGQPIDSAARERLIPALRGHPTTLVLLAMTEGRAVGAAVCFLGFSTFQARTLLNIHDLAVMPEWRSRGLGRALLAAAEERARDRGCCRLTLEVLEKNDRARALYSRFGFSDYAADGTGPTHFLVKPL